MAFDHLLVGQKVDLVISGINHGANASVNADFTASQYYCKKIITSILENDLPEPTCLNVNIPKGELGSIKGMCR